VVNLYLPWMCG